MAARQLRGKKQAGRPQTPCAGGVEQRQRKLAPHAPTHRLLVALVRQRLLDADARFVVRKRFGSFGVERSACYAAAE
jgi:hypothetical protein